jgi:hypothetical protein
MKSQLFELSKNSANAFREYIGKRKFDSFPLHLILRGGTLDKPLSPKVKKAERNFVQPFEEFQQ